MRTVASVPIVDDLGALGLFVDELAAIEARIEVLNARADALRVAIAAAMRAAKLDSFTSDAAKRVKLVRTEAVTVEP